MSEKASAKLTGAFVLGAIVLILAGLFVFGSGKFFQARIPVVMFFRESVNGLSVGAPLNFNGVNVGLVTDIDLVWNLEDNTFETPVYADILPDALKYSGRSSEFIDRLKRGELTEEIDRSLVERGLRAQLGVSSIITGKLQINLVMRPDTEVVWVLEHDPKFDEIPTITSDIAEIKSALRRVMTSFSRLKLDEVIDDAASAIDATRTLVTNPDIPKAISEAKDAAATLNALLQRLDAKVDPLTDSLIDTSDAAGEAVGEAKQLFSASRGAVADARKVLEGAQRTFESAERFLSAASNSIEPGSALHEETVTTLRDVAAAARSLRSLADTLERDPNSILFGRR